MQARAVPSGGFAKDSVDVEGYVAVPDYSANGVSVRLEPST
jgi:hypothetical protein